VRAGGGQARGARRQQQLPRQQTPGAEAVAGVRARTCTPRRLPHQRLLRRPQPAEANLHAVAEEGDARAADAQANACAEARNTAATGEVPATASANEFPTTTGEISSSAGSGELTAATREIASTAGSGEHATTTGAS